MPIDNLALFIFTFVSALILSLILTPAARAAAIIFNILDHPVTSVKTHKEPVPYLGGLAIFIAFTFSLLWVRVLTSFPTGTLRALRGILVGGAIIFVMGLVDDIRHGGLNYRVKFLLQATAAVCVMLFGVQVKFIQPAWFGWVISILWIVGVTNAFNIIDIMDGLSSSAGVIAALCFLFISLPTEELYVNFAAAAMAGAALGFVPYNLSKSWRIFMGDSGSLLLGFVCASLALGTSYTETSRWGVLAPLLILIVPLFDTSLVSIIRMRRGMSPFMGSKDHFPLRLERLGWPRKNILVFCIGIACLGGLAAAAATRLPNPWPPVIFGISAFTLFLFTRYLLKAPVA